MRKLMCVAVVLAPVLAVAVDDKDNLLNQAAQQAVSAAKVSLEKTAAEKPDVQAMKRIGVAVIEGDNANIGDLLKSALTKTAFNVVLTNDKEWGPLLDEFARQVKRKDLILNETAHKLHVQGVDGVVFGKVEKALVEPFESNGRKGKRADVRVMLNLASVIEQNPGSLVWSEQFTGASESTSPLTLEEQVVAFVQNNRPVLAAIAILCLLLVIARGYRRAMTPR